MNKCRAAIHRVSKALPALCDRRFGKRDAQTQAQQMQPLNDVPLPVDAPAAPFQATVNDVIGTGLAQSILDSSPDCIKLLSLDGRLLYMNHNGLCAMEIDEFCGIANKPWPSLWPAEAQDLLLSAIEDAALGQRSEFDAYCPTARGLPRWWNVNVAPVRDAKGKVYRILATSRDVTDRIQTENTLHERDLQLQAYAEKLTAELKSKENLLERQSLLSAEIDHRVKNSFALIGSLLRLKMQGMADTEARDALSDAANRIGTLSRVHEQLHTDVEDHAVDLAPFMEKLITDLSATLSDASSVTVAGLVEVPVRSDVAVALGLVAAECVSNALKHKKSAHPTEVSVSLTEDSEQGELTLRIADTGKGLASDFDLDSTRSLGLQICKTYARTLNGTLTANNNRHGGAVFALTFPKSVALK